MDTIPTLLVGCGSRGKTHANAISQSNRFELTALCDRNPENTAEIAAQYDITPTFTSVEEALDQIEPAHVSAVIAPIDRRRLVETILESEPDSLLLEKPVANRRADVEAIANMVQDSRTAVAVCHQKPYADEFQILNDWIESRIIGKPTRLIATTKGGLTGQGTHVIHALNWLLSDEPIAVRAYSGGPQPLDPTANPHVPDHAEPEETVFELQYDDETYSYVHLGPNAPDIPEQAGTYWYEFRIDAVGSGGVAELVLGDHAEVVCETDRRRASAREFEENAYMTTQLYNDFADHLASDSESWLADFDAALAVHRTVDAVLRSSYEGRAVQPEEFPIEGGTDSTQLLRSSLVRQRPIVVSTAPFASLSRIEAFETMAKLGVRRVDLWGTTGTKSHFSPYDDDSETIVNELKSAALEVRTVTIGTQDIAEHIAFAMAMGAKTVIIGAPQLKGDHLGPTETRQWCKQAHESGGQIGLVPGFGVPETIEGLQEFLASVDHPAATVALAPPPLERNGERTGPAISRIGSDLSGLYFWDVAPQPPQAVDEWWRYPEVQLPGAGGAVDFEQVHDLQVSEAPLADIILRYDGVSDWPTERINAAIASGLRFLQSVRS